MEHSIAYLHAELKTRQYRWLAVVDVMLVQLVLWGVENASASLSATCMVLMALDRRQVAVAIGPSHRIERSRRKC